MAGNEEYAEEIEAERELADSAMWKVIQKNTFTRWTNEHLKHTKMQIVDMEKDFSDGLKLIALIESLSGKKFAKFNKRPSFRTQKFENVTMSLKFLEDKEGIKLVNIDSSDIVDQKLKLIMGLIWTLILHYSISMPTWEDEGGPAGKDLTPKQRLLAWIQNKIPEKNITNFTSDWNDGTAIAALVDAVAPGLFPEWPNLSPANKIPNAKEAMDLAEKFLDVPQVIKPDEMCNPKVDELSMMTYLSRFPSAKLKSGAPVQQKPNAHRIKAYGPGIEPQGNVVGAPARFIVETASAGKGDLEVIALSPKGKQEKVELLPNNDRTVSYNCVYTPSVDGNYTVSIKFAGQPSTKQPYPVFVAPKEKTGDPSKVIAQGPGIEKTGVHVNRKTYFDVITKGAGVGVVDVGVFDPQNKPLKATVTKKSDDVWYVEYTAEVPGLHSVNINFAGKPIPKSPYPVGVGAENGPAVDASKLPGKPVACSPRDAAANSLATPLKAAPGSTAPAAEPQPQAKPGKQPGAPAEVIEPQAPGQGPAPAAKPGAPKADIPIDAKRCWASGRGIQPKGVRLGDVADFKIHTENAGNAEPRALVMGPGGQTVQTSLKKLDDDTYECTYKPTKPGLHIINVTFAGQQIPKSPFKVDIGPLKTSKVVAFGPGLESGVVNQPAKFTVKPNGEGPIGFKIEGPSQAKIDVTKNPQQTEMYVSYLPTSPGEYAVRVLSNNDDIPKSPYMVDISPVGEAPVEQKPVPGVGAGVPVDASKVTASGPGLEKEGNVVGKWAEFTVDATKAGQAALVVTAADSDKKTVEVIVVDNKNWTFSCKYLPTRVTTYTITITYGGKPVPKSPFSVNVKDSGIAASKVKVFGPAIEKPVQAKILSYYIIDCKEAGPGEPQVTLTNEKDQPLNFQKRDLRDRTYRVEFTAVVSGMYTTKVTFGGQPVPKSPFPINVMSGPDASKVKVYGPALEKPVNINELTYFIVDCKEAGPGEPRVMLMGEKGVTVQTKVIDQNDRTYKVEFTTTIAGIYNANVQFASSPVPKSPFRITAQAAVDIRQVFVKDLPEFVPVNKEVKFEVVTAGAGPGKVKVVITSPSAKSVPAQLDEKPGVATVTKFIPMEAGPYKVEVFFAEQPVAKSPFQVTAEASKPFNVKVYGPAVEQPVFLNEVTFFVVDYKEAGPGEPQVKLVDEKGTPIPFNVLDQKDKTSRIEFTPVLPGTSTATITFAAQPVPKSPYKITVQIRPDVNKVKVYGPAVEAPVAPKVTTYFVIDCKEAGPGQPEVTLADDSGVPVPFLLNDNKDGTYKTEFTPQSVIPLTANVRFAGQPVPKSPFKISISGGLVDPTKVKIFGPAVEGPVLEKVPTYFVVDCKEAGPGKPEVKLVADNGAPVPAKVTDNNDGTHQVSFVPESVVPINAEVKFESHQVPKSPFKISVQPGKKADVSKVKLTGPAVESPVKSSTPTFFVVDAKEAGPGHPEVTLTSESGVSVKPVTVTDHKDGTYKVDFVPVLVQPITARVKYAGEPVPQSPLKIMVEPVLGADPTKVRLYGPAAEGPVKANQPTFFVVDAKEAGPGYPEVILTTDDGCLVKPKITDNKDGTYKAEFVPVVAKPITAQVKYAGKQVPKSPFKIPVQPGAVDVSKVKLSGPAVEGPVKSQEPTYFVVDAKEAGPGIPVVALKADNGAPVPAKVIDNNDGTFVASFTPEAVIPITADVKFSGQQVPKTPFKIPVEQGTGVKPDASKVKLYGPAVEGPVVSEEPTYFVVDAKEAGPGYPEATLFPENAAPIKPQVVDRKNGTYQVNFVPLLARPIVAQVKFADKPVPKSPFKIQVQPGKTTDASKVKVFGPAVEAPVKSNQPTYFVVDTKEAGPGQPEVKLLAANGASVPVTVTDNHDGTFVSNFVPEAVVPIMAEVKFAGQQVPKSPFQISVQPGVAADVSKVKVYGPAVEHPVKAHEPTFFVVDTKEAGPVTEPIVSVVKSDGAPVPLQKTDNKDGTYKVDFVPNDVGVILSNVTVAGQPVPGSPFKITVQPKSAAPAKVAEIPKVLTVGKPEPINIHAAGPKAGPATVELVGPHGNVVASPVYEKPDGFLSQVVAQEPGPHKIVVKVANEPAEGSPFQVEAVPAALAFVPSDVIDPNKVKVYGPGLHGGTTNKPCDFTIDTSAAGPGNLGLTIDGPTEAKIECFDKGNGVFDVRYLPNEPGEYTINVTFDEKPIPHSPFKAQVNPEILVDVSRVRTFGQGIEPHGVFLDSVTEFTVDTATVQPKGLGHVKVILTNPSGTLTEAIVNKNDNDTYTCLYTPFEEGLTKIDVTYDGLRVPGSPFSTNVIPGCDPTKVKVYGSGIERGEPNKPQKFIINTRGAGMGGVGLSVVGPTEPQVDCVDNQDGTLSVEYLPESPGDYEIGVTFSDQPVPGSPFIVPVGAAVQPFFPERVKCFGPGLNPQGVKLGQKAVFTVVTNQAGEAVLEVSVTDVKTGVKIPAKINKQPSGSYDVEYEPHNEGPIRVDVLYGGKPVPGSPFNTTSVPFTDLTKVVVSGDGVRPQVPASLPISFNVDTRSAAPAPLPVDIDIKTPQGKVVKPVITPVAPGVSQVRYTPEDAGSYLINVKVSNQEVPNSPIRVSAVPTGNPEKVILPDNLPTTVAPNQIFTYKVQKPNTVGMGNVTCKVTKAGQPGFPATEIPATVQDNHDGTVSVSYPAPDEGVVIVETKFGGVLVPRGRFTQKVGRPGEPTLTPLIPSKVSVGEVAPQAPHSPVTPISPSTPFKVVEVTSIPVGPDVSQVSAVVIKPSGESVPVQVAETQTGSVKVIYSPTEPGPHVLKVLYAGQPVPGDPFSFFVHAPKPGQVTAFGPGLVSGTVSQPCIFTVVTKNAGPGGLSLAIEGPSKAEIKCQDNRDGSATITYTPTSPGEYKVVVKHAGHPIPGAPFVAKITGEDRSIFTRSITTTTEQSTTTRQSHVTVGSTRHLTIQVTESDLSNLSAQIRSPSGVEEPCGLKRQPSGQLGISFTPKESGEHLVTVYRDGQPIPGSPFKIFIQATEVGDASKVKVYGQNVAEGQANEVNSFIINTKEAGVAGLSISVQGPGKVDIKCTENEDGTTQVTYKPTEPGVYHVTIKYGDKPVPGSPFTINVGGIPSGRVRERIVRQQQAATTTSVGTMCELNITMPGINVNEVEGCVTSPSGQIEKCQVVDLGSNKFRISFSPKESGVHYVSLKHKGLHIPGSPFQFTVGPIVGGGPEKVKALGPGLVRGEANKPCHFTVITREAGAGSLSLGVEGPSKAVIDFQDKKDGTSDVNYVCSEPGEYLVSVKFNGQHIPDSPFKVFISSTGGDGNRLHVQNLQQHGLPINTQTQFLVEFNGAQGKLDAKVVAPSGLESEATVQEVRPGHFSVMFMPKESGVHYVHLLLNGHHIPGSPYPVQVGVVNADPSRVRAYGEGLHHGQSGKACKFIVNTTESGPGALSVGISGPSKVELQTTEVEEGYEFTYTPLAPGPYLITIKYAGNTHVPGSPFKAQIEGMGTPAAFTEQSRVIVETVTKTTTSSSHQGEFICDLSKVMATGTGLSQAVVNQESTFLVDGSQAGYNALHVGVAGPNIPVEKIFINHLGNLRYSVRYEVNQPGRYLIYVKWGEQHIPGSPFTVVAK